jgi:hypothetical protein
MERVTYRDTPIAGTTVFTGERSRQGYRINKLAMSLTDPANRAGFRAEAARWDFGRASWDDARPMICKRS